MSSVGKERVAADREAGRLFRETGASEGAFHGRSSTGKGRDGGGLAEAGEVRKRRQGHTEASAG